jgi:hypothetical protein
VETVRDPVEKLRLRIELARWTESRGDVAAARQMADSILHDHPRILGAVRAATDLHWRTGARARAVDILEQAAASSYPELRRRLLREAAAKATDSTAYARARRLLETLLKETPFDAAILAAMAETWEREGNFTALRSFYASKIEELRKSPLPAADRDSRLAALRRAYIPVLTGRRSAGSRSRSVCHHAWTAGPAALLVRPRCFGIAQGRALADFAGASGHPL